MDAGQDVARRVLAAAKKLFIDEGYAATPLRAIAAEAGTSESGILRFYENKDELLHAVMGSCWAQVNDRQAEALRVSQQESHDPRFLLIELVRAALQQAEDEKPIISFLVSHFRFSYAVGFDERNVHRNRPYTEAYREYRNRIDQLCARVADNYPGLARIGVSRLALCHLTLSLIHGVAGGWYMSENDPATHGEKVTLEEVLTLFRSILYSRSDGAA